MSFDIDIVPNETKIVKIILIYRQNIYIDYILSKRKHNDSDEKAATLFGGNYLDEHRTWKYHIPQVNTNVSRSLFCFQANEEHLT